MVEEMKIGNGNVAPLTYETIERAEDSRSKAVEAMKKEDWDIANMFPEELLKKQKKILSDTTGRGISQEANRTGAA